MKKFVLFFILFLQYSFAQLITIDAIKDPFYDTLTGPQDGFIYLPPDAALAEGAFVYPDDEDDHHALFWSAWDDEYFYYYVEVTDDLILVNNSVHWQNDCIEIKYDPDPSSSPAGGTVQTTMTAYDADGAQEASGVDNINTRDLNLINTDGEIWVPEDWVDWYRDYELPPLYILEWRVPLAYVNRITATDTLILNPAVGNIFGAAINASDNDGTARESMIQWSAGHADAVWSNPGLMGTVEFLADNKLGWTAVNARDDAVINVNAEDWYTPPATSAIEPTNINNPGTFSLSQNYPNPFNPETSISYTVNNNDNTSLIIYNITGEVISKLIDNSFHNAGIHSVKWNGLNSKGNPVSSGVYFYRLIQGNNVSTKKMMLVR